MGALLSHQNAGVEELEIGVNHAYRYPPKHGNYFSNHFIMGGERFDTAMPEMYLFGENMDLNFLGSRPAPFPYPAPSASEPSKTLKAVINIHKESLRFVKVPEETNSLKSSEPAVTRPNNITNNNPLDGMDLNSVNADLSEPPHESPPSFNIEFTFDCDVRCAITIMYFCTEESTSQGLVYIPRDPTMNSETYHYKRGANQQFSQSTHLFTPSIHPEADLLYTFDRDLFPVIVNCVAEEGDEPRQSQVTIGVVEKHSDGFVLKALKQKLFVHGLCYLLQEIYGIENKNSEAAINGDNEGEDNGAECVICMCDLRDTLILPCRHLCLCNCCADSLRYQANNCPICRAPFRALLQIKALQKTCVNGGIGVNAGSNPTHLPPAHESTDIPPGYEAVSLIEALNGPSASPPVQPTAPLTTNSDMYVRLPPSGTGLGGNLLEDSTTQTDSSAHANNNNKSSNSTNNGSSLDGNHPVRMSVLLAAESASDSGVYDASSAAAGAALNKPVIAGSGTEEEEKTTGGKGSRRRGSSSRRKAKAARQQQGLSSSDTVKIVNEIQKLHSEDPNVLDGVDETEVCGATGISRSQAASPHLPVAPHAVLECDPLDGSGSDNDCFSEDCTPMDAPAKKKRLGEPDEHRGHRSPPLATVMILSHGLQSSPSPPYLDCDPGVVNPVHTREGRQKMEETTQADRQVLHELETGDFTVEVEDECAVESGKGMRLDGSPQQRQQDAPQHGTTTTTASSTSSDSSNHSSSGFVLSTVEQQALPSMPGTPLSNASTMSNASNASAISNASNVSAISSASDVSSTTSASSSQALLQRTRKEVPGGTVRASVV